jgi:small subunit ribosomal protein S1
MANEQPEFSEADMSQLLDEHDYDMPQQGDIRIGVILSMNQQGAIVDLGLKRDGFVPAADINRLSEQKRDSLEINGEVPVFIVNADKPDSLVCSIHRAVLNEDWVRAEELMESGEIVEVEISQFNRGGAIAPFGNLRGFIPSSHLTDLSRGMNDKQRQQRLAKLRGETVPAKVIEVDRQRRRLVLSQREAQREWADKRREELMENLNEGDVVRGRVTGMRDFGAFVDIGGADGLVHISELAWHRVKHPRDILQIGDELDVYILKLDAKAQRIALSRRRTLPSPWSLAADNYREGQLVEGRVIRLVDYGGFIELEPGIEGLLHISQLSHANINHPSEVVREGETHLLRILSIDVKQQRIGLSLKAVTTTEQMDWMASQTAAEADSPTKAGETEEDPAGGIEVESGPEEAGAASAEASEVELEDQSAEAPEATIDADVEDATDAEVEDAVEAEVEDAAEAEVEDAAEAEVEDAAEAEADETADVEAEETSDAVSKDTELTDAAVSLEEEE